METNSITSKYPTKEEILAEPYELSNELYEAIREWKRRYFNGQWKEKTNELKFLALEELIHMICAHSGNDLNHPEFETHQGGWCYESNGPYYVGGTIFGEIGRPSIISALHELGHHLFGESELNACRFSTSIFMKCFPNSYKNLIWDGHMLKKPNAE